jgi:ribosomal protein S18 acetylase RimI-like enzyme
MTELYFTTLPVMIDKAKAPTLYIHAHDQETHDVVGMCRLETEDKAAWLASLFVAEPYRSKGIGSELLARCYEHCKRLGKSYLRLNVHNENDRAKALYVRLGFDEFSPSYDGYTEYIKRIEYQDNASC